MIYAIAALCVAAAAVNALPTRSSSKVSGTVDMMLPKFMEYQQQFGKVYESQEAEDKAFEAFKYNDAVIEESNAQDLSYTLGHNEYTDMMWEDFAEYMGIGLLTERAEGVEPVETHVYNGEKYADSVDWTTKNAVTPVKNQAQCGSCWSFSTTGSLEGAYAIASKTLVSLSEEELVQCDKVDQGCQGGLMDNAFKWIEGNGGLATEECYPYTSGTGTRGTCAPKKCANSVTLTGFKDVTSGDEDALATAVALGPVSVAIEADKSVFQSYKSGILDSAACGKKLDHGVLVVGYGTDGEDYWKVKNSWGATWGEQGYLRMARGKNMCGIAQQPSYPTGAAKAAPGPAPSPTPTPTPTPSPSGSTHYEDPNTTGSCMTDEVDISIQNVQGSVCAPACSLFKACPTDLPKGVTANPQCALEDASTNKKYCALICNPSEDDAQCGAKASCKSVQAGIGICTYDS